LGTLASLTVFLGISFRLLLWFSAVVHHVIHG
jgi:hypothetical protein